MKMCAGEIIKNFFDNIIGHISENAGGKIKKNEMGGACSGGGERCAQGYIGRNLRERDHWGDPDVDGRIILKWFFGKS